MRQSCYVLHKYIYNILREDVKITNMYAPNIRAPKYTKYILTELKEEMNVNTVRVGNPHSQQWIDHSDRESKRKQQM